MSLSSLSRRRPAYTDQYSYVRGEYAIGDEKVPYFSISMTIREADQYLRLARELAFSDDEPVNLEELFQRTVDEDRAAGPIATYLRQPGSLKFFNAFTVVLLPVDTDKADTVAESYSEDSDAPAESPDGDLERTSIGPVQIDNLPGMDIGFIRWSTKRARAVILDGQHRFLALKKILDSPQTNLLKPDTTKIPVLLLVLDERAGFVPARDQDRLLHACRSIFVALNKHAVAVSKTRTYLLDDQDIVSVSMRRLLTSEVGDGRAGQESIDRIPLALVDWHSDQAKFDRGLHLTSVLGLHETIRQIYPSRCDESDYEGLREYITKVSALIGPEGDSRWSELALRNRVSKHEDDALPFIFSAEEVSAVADAFVSGLGQAIVRPLMQLEPYKRLREGYEAGGLIGGPLELWLGFDKYGKQAFQTRTGNDPSDLARSISEDVKTGDNAFAVVFQRGILLSAVRFDIARSDFVVEWGCSSDRFAVLDCWIERVNKRITPYLASPDFWLGTGIKGDRNVNYTKVGANGVKGFVSLAVMCPVDELRENTASLIESDIRSGALTESERLAWKMISDPESPYLRDDRLMADAADHSLQFAAYRWLAEQFGAIGRGRAPSIVAGVMRAACIEYRNAAKVYVQSELRAAGVPADEDVVLQGVLVLGARRLAQIVQSSV
ncbi:DNA sulfur modification protein DndB [Streptomyces sp. MUSC 125]|uniref:DNA sulfur modification protein DndB n=1 Tax=Streptomyces sp. MUSC 125 TaxID=1428624 RepID=UPI00099D1525|nr:DNA sulfur modification protein DndB [Streptomyces sp. MUSC 125]